MRNSCWTGPARARFITASPWDRTTPGRSCTRPISPPEQSTSSTPTFNRPRYPEALSIPIYPPASRRSTSGRSAASFTSRTLLQDDSRQADVPGAGNGLIDVFDSNGNLVQRLVSNGNLNSPWGLALAPDFFGDYSNTLLVGNFGDGAINAFDLSPANIWARSPTATEIRSTSPAVGAPVRQRPRWRRRQHALLYSRHRQRRQRPGSRPAGFDSNRAVSARICFLPSGFEPCVRSPFFLVRRLMRCLRLFYSIRTVLTPARNTSIVLVAGRVPLN